MLPDEKVVYKAKLHWMIVWKPSAMIFLGAVFLLILPIAGIIVLIIGIIALIPP